MIQKIQRITRNYFHKNGIRQDSYIREVQTTIKEDYSIPSGEIEHITYAQLSPFKLCEITFSKDIATNMGSVFENSDDYEVTKIDENQVEINKIEVVEDEIVRRKIGELNLRSQKVYIDFVRENNGKSLQASPTTEKTLSLIEEYFAIKGY